MRPQLLTNYNFLILRRLFFLLKFQHKDIYDERWINEENYASIMGSKC